MRQDFPDQIDEFVIAYQPVIQEVVAHLNAGFDDGRLPTIGELVDFTIERILASGKENAAATADMLADWAATPLSQEDLVKDFFAALHVGASVSALPLITDPENPPEYASAPPVLIEKLKEAMIATLSAPRLVA